MKIKLLILSLLAISIRAYSITPIDSLWQVLKTATDKEKSVIHQQIAQQWTKVQQQDSVKKHVDYMLSWAEQTNNALLLEQLINADKILMVTGDFEHGKQLYNKYLKKFESKNNKLGIATCYYNLGRISLFTGQLSEAKKFLSKAHQLSEGDKNLQSTISINLGGVYNREGRYTEALQILTDALSVVDSTKNTKDYCGLLFTIGNTYGIINDPKTALGYYQKVLSVTRKTGDIMGEANVLTNLASANSNLKNYAEAEKYAREALAIVSNRHLMAEAEVLSVLTDVMLKQDKYNELEKHYSRMYQIADITGNSFVFYQANIGTANVAYHHKNYDRAITLLKPSLSALEEQGGWSETIPGYKLLSDSYRQSGDYKNALDALTKFHTYEDSTYNQDKVKELALLQSKLAFQKKELVYEKEQRVKNVTIVSLTIIFLLAAVMAVFIFKSKQKQNRQKQLLLHSQLEIAEHSLKLSELKLDDFTKRMQEKANLVEEMQQQLAFIKDIDNNVITQLQQYIILTEEDWQNFKSLFEQVHSGFLRRLKEKYKEVSPAEIRYLALAKLQFSTKEMAAALGVSTQSIRTNWYRIRKKLDLPDSMTVEELIAEI